MEPSVTSLTIEVPRESPIGRGRQSLKKGRDVVSHVLVLHTCHGDDLVSPSGFRWPESGPVEVPNLEPSCHHHDGFLWGDGFSPGINLGDTVRWVVVEVPLDQIRYFSHSVRYDTGTVVCCDRPKKAIQYIKDHGGASKAIIHDEITLPGDALASVGSYGKATTGDKGSSFSGRYGESRSGLSGKSVSEHGGTSLSGNGGQALSGSCGHSKVGDGGFAHTGAYGKARGGDDSTVEAKNFGEAITGIRGLALSGLAGFSKAGDHGIAISGNGGTSQVGQHGIAQTGVGGSAIAGLGGQIRIAYQEEDQMAILIGHIGEEGLLPDTTYVVVRGCFTSDIPPSPISRW